MQTAFTFKSRSNLPALSAKTLVRLHFNTHTHTQRFTKAEDWVFPFYANKT